MKNILLFVTCLFCLSCSFNAKKKELREQNANQISTVKVDSIQINRDTLSTNTKFSGERQDSDSSFLIHLLIVFISIFSSVIIILVYNNITFRNKTIRTILESNRIRDFIKSFITTANVSQISAKVNPIGLQSLLNDRDIDLLAQRVLETIKKENPDLFNKKEDVPNIISTIIPDIVIPEVSMKRTKFYSVEPRDGVSFNGTGFSDEFIATESVYFIELQNDNLAHFSIIVDNDTMGRAIKYKKELIDTACESLSSSIETKSIVTEKCGIALKDGNKWVIKQKAQIKFV